MRNPSSFLHWMRRMLQVRKQHADVFGLGTFEVLGAENPSVLAYVREHEGDRILCVNNLSRFAQPVELQLGRYEGMYPVELLGRVQFPRIGELPYLLTLGSHDFYWFQLVEGPS
jgi:maltose alpha-D-glucosyltransferase/alpha-amylase